MKKLFFINDTLANKISYFFIAFFLIALPFQHFYSEMLLLGFAIHTFIHFDKKRLPALRNKSIWIVASLFFLNLIAIFYSNYKAEGFKNAGHQLGILLFPICLSLNNIDPEKYKLPLLKLFSLTCTVTIVYLYIDAFRIIHYFDLPSSSIFSKSFINHNFSAPIGLHATYLSMYVALSISAFFFLFFSNPGFKNWKYLFFIVILLAGLIQLSSRSAFIATGIIIVIVVPSLLLHGKKKLQFFMVSLIASLLIIVVITKVDSFRKRYISDLGNDLSDYTDPGNQSESRLLRWNLEWELIQKSPFVGYGSGSEKYILKEKYFEKKFYRSYLLELNAHNQYLSFLINTGFVGLLLYLYILYYGFLSAIKRKDFLLVSFLILIAFVSISENILDVNKGVFFYSFFFTLFLLSISKENTAASF